MASLDGHRIMLCLRHQPSTELLSGMVAASIWFSASVLDLMLGKRHIADEQPALKKPVLAILACGEAVLSRRRRQ